ncbi:MAG: acyl-CoA dehydrogenase [Deltaproteobacteria bacterium]|jgi:alkylation response protein AidB-like acyl-CoA dehydrogenase|nr:MAG: acyl-CoA dehydrogenase [Deltaproteobacteria bacterium]
MDFELTEEQKILQDTVRKFMDNEVAPIVEECEKKKEMPRDLIKKLIPLGYVGALVPPEYGGLGLDYISLGILMEEAGRTWGALRIMANGPLNLIPYTICVNGTEEQKKKYLPSLLSADKTGFIAITEPNVGSDASGIETRADLQDGHFIVNGTKMWVTNGSTADVGIIFASTDRSKGPGGISAFIVDKKETPYSATDIEKMFGHAMVASELVFEDAKVPKENMFGPEGKGLKIALTTLNEGRHNVAMGSVGIAQACINASVKYAKERKQFGKPIGSFQLVQKLIVEMVADTMASRLLGYQAAKCLETGGRCDRFCSVAKLFACEAAFKTASNALQVHGGYGYSKEFPVERYFRDARGAMIPEGTTEIQTLIIGRDVLGMSAIR